MTEPGLSGGDCEVTGQKRQIQEDYINDFAISASEIKTENKCCRKKAGFVRWKMLRPRNFQ